MNPNKKLSLITLLMLGLAGFMILSGCQQSQPPAEKAAAGIHQTFEKGPVSVEVNVDQSAITVADRLKLNITVSAPVDHEVALPDKLPESEEKSMKFSLVEATAPSVEITEGGGTRTTRTYVLEPFLAGAYTIPAMSVHFRKTGGETEKPDGIIATAEIPVTVTSLLSNAANDAEIKPHDIRPPAPLPPQMAVWYWSAGIAAGLLLAGFGIFLILRKRRNARLVAAELVIPPHDIAFAAMDRLMAENLIEKGEIKLFYQEISGILRRYIEARFGLRAPEQTTEEFLDGLKTGAALDNRYQGLLKQFLTHCDLVKFAAHRPTGEDIRNTIDSCRTFVQETRPMAEGI